MAIEVKATGCPVCGYPEMQNLDEFGCTTFEICESCGCEAGYEFDRDTSKGHILKLRRNWVVSNGCKWWGSINDQPKNWNPGRQMRNAGLVNE